MTGIPVGMAVRGHLRQREAGKPQAQAFWEPEEGEHLLCNPFSTTPKQEAGHCPFWQPCPVACEKYCLGGRVSVSEFTSTDLEEQSQLVLAAWAARVCALHTLRGLQAPRSTWASLRPQRP